MSETPRRVKRFYKAATLAEEGGRFFLTLDGKPARTRGRAMIANASRPLIEAIAEEWDAQQDHIDQSSMPLTGILSTAIDAGPEDANKWRGEILDYLKSDLVCYRAEAPAALAERQAQAWDPYLEFMRAEFGAALVNTAGIVAVAQPDMSIDAVEKRLRAEPAEVLFALRLATAMSGSAAIALGLYRGFVEAGDAFRASRVDEDFQAEKWGADEEAKQREARIEAEFQAVARFLAFFR